MRGGRLVGSSTFLFLPPPPLPRPLCVHSGIAWFGRRARQTKVWWCWEAGAPPRCRSNQPGSPSAAHARCARPRPPSSLRGPQLAALRLPFDQPHRVGRWRGVAAPTAPRLKISSSRPPCGTPPALALRPDKPGVLSAARWAPCPPVLSWGPRSLNAAARCHQEFTLAGCASMVRRSPARSPAPSLARRGRRARARAAPLSSGAFASRAHAHRPHSPSPRPPSSSRPKVRPFLSAPQV